MSSIGHSSARPASPSFGRAWNLWRFRRATSTSTSTTRPPPLPPLAGRSPGRCFEGTQRKEPVTRLQVSSIRLLSPPCRQAWLDRSLPFNAMVFYFATPRRSVRRSSRHFFCMKISQRLDGVDLSNDLDFGARWIGRWEVASTRILHSFFGAFPEIFYRSFSWKAFSYKGGLRPTRRR